jgi:hypothetical protein
VRSRRQPDYSPGVLASTGRQSYSVQLSSTHWPESRMTVVLTSVHDRPLCRGAVWQFDTKVFDYCGT